MIFRSGKTRSILLLVTMTTFVLSCRQLDVYEKNTPIPHYQWQHNFAVSGTFHISDTTAAYNIYIVLRHTDAYKYNNIWLKAGLQAPGDTMLLQNINLTLASDARGWEGSGMNDIWEVRKLLNSQPRRFKKSGDYTFTITQIMRDAALTDIMSVGMRVQKAY